jgi:hypothetical protein
MDNERSFAPVALLFSALGAFLAGGVAALHSEDLIHHNHLVTNRDFANYWLGSKLWLDGNVLDLFRGQKTYFNRAIEAFGPDFTWHNWSYPPHFVFFTLPLALMPLPASLVVSELVTLAFFLHASWLVERRLTGLTAVLLLPFILCNILFAQNGFLTGALMLYGLSLRGSRPILAGIAYGLLTTKPQLGILLPFLLLYERRWLVIASAAASALALVALSAVVFGMEAWSGYITHNLPYQTAVMRLLDGTFLEMMTSLYGGLRSHGWTADPAMAIHAPWAITGTLIFIWTLVVLQRPQARALSTLVATFIVTPYGLTYDLGALCALAAIAVHSQVPGEPGRLNLWFAPLCLLPIVGQPLAATGLIVAPLVMVLAWAGLLYDEQRRGQLSLRLKPLKLPRP